MMNALRMRSAAGLCVSVKVVVPQTTMSACAQVIAKPMVTVVRAAIVLPPRVVVGTLQARLAFSAIPLKTSVPTTPIADPIHKQDSLEAVGLRLRALAGNVSIPSV